MNTDATTIVVELSAEEARAREIANENPQLFMVGNKPQHFTITKKAWGVDPVELDFYTRSEGKEVGRQLRFVLIENRIPKDAYRRAELSDTTTTEVTGYVSHDEGEAVFLIPPIEVDVEDNDYINNYLKGMFRESFAFIREYLAVLAYTNYTPLPIIVLLGERGTGKTTFAEMVMDMYPNLGVMWCQNGTDFNEELSKKVIFIEENVNDHKSQYVKLKELTGTRNITINPKYGLKYRVKNNTNFIIASNEKTPMYFEHDELPASEKQNGFFVFECKRENWQFDSGLAEKLRSRLGHYIRTELQDVFKDLQESGKLGSARYSIPCPITPEEVSMFKRNVTANQLHANQVYEDLTGDLGSKFIYQNKRGTPANPAGDYITFTDLKDLVAERCGAKTSNGSKALLKKMQEQGYLSDAEHRTNQKTLGYRVIPRAERGDPNRIDTTQ